MEPNVLKKKKKNKSYLRKLKIRKKTYLPDSKFNDPLVTRFVSHIIKKGKKTLAYKIFYDSMKSIDLNQVNKKMGALEIWKEALKNVMPHVEIKARRVGGANIQIPVILPSEIKITRAIKYLIESARKRKGKSMADRLAIESIAASKGEGMAVKRKENIQKMAEANKAFSHFRF